MTASSMNAFLKNLFDNSPDYKFLTQKLINNAYMEHMQLSILEEEDRLLLKEMTHIMFDKKMEMDRNNLNESEEEGSIKKSNSKKIEISESDDNLSENLIDTNSNDIAELEDKSPKNKENITNINDSNPIKIGTSLNENKFYNDSQLKIINKFNNSNSIKSDNDSNISDMEDNQNVTSETEIKSSKENNKKDSIFIPNKKKLHSRSPSLSSISKSDSNDIPSPNKANTHVKKKRKKINKEIHADVEIKMLAADGSSDEEMPLDQLKSKIHSDKKHKSYKKMNSEKKLIKTKEKAPEKSQKLKHVEKIARICGILPVGMKYAKTFEGCENEIDKIKVIKKLLKDAGMDGKISIEKAEHIKLKREAAELNTNNILSPNGRGVRNVHSAYSRHQKQYEPIDRTPLMNKLDNLRDIIDSDSD